MTFRRLARPVALLLVYGILFAIFDTQAIFFEIAPGVSLWYPSAGLNLALVLVGGVAYAPAIFVALLASGLWISEPAIAVQHLLLLGNGVAAWWLGQTLRDRLLFTPAAVVRMVIAMAALAAWNALAGSTSYWLTGQAGYTLANVPSTAFSWWIGDWAGMLTLTPLLLLGTAAMGLYRPNEPHAERTLLRGLPSGAAWIELGIEIGAVVLSLIGAFLLFDAPYQLYLCFLPLLWVALRHGIMRATACVLLVNTGALLVLRGSADLDAVLHLQLFVVALALTGLCVGALASERQRAMQALEQALGALEGETEASHDAPEATDAFLDDDVLRVADQLRSKQEQLAEDAGVLHTQNQALRSTEARLKRQNQRKDQLFSIIAHDLRNHIGTATGLADFLEEKTPTAPRDTLAELAHHLSQSTRQAQSMLSSLLDWAQVYVSAAQGEAAPQPVAALVETTLQHVEQDVARKDLTLDCTIPSDLTVYGHAALVQTVLRNLVSNAIKFTPPGEHITVKATRQDAETRLCVRDTGVGIPERELDDIFTPSRRRSRDGTDGERGAGMGLALCRELIEQHGGRIWAESTPDEGSMFCFTLPAPDDGARGDGSSVEATAVE